MPTPRANSDPPQALRDAARSLTIVAWIVRYGLFAVGLGLLLDQTRDLISDAQFTWGERRVMAISAGVYLLAFGGAAWVAGRLIQTLSVLFAVVADHARDAARTADLLEQYVAPALERLAVAAERAQSRPVPDGRGLAREGVQQALEAKRWSRAEALAQAYRRDFPDAPDGASLLEEVALARGEAVASLKARLEASRVANDPDQVIDYRDQLTEHLRGDDLRDLDRELVHWLMLLVQKRLRRGAMGPDVARLAARIAESFGDTPEGASLRTSLPTLRRSAGLCPRCAEPYTGLGDACPKCAGRTARPAPEPVETSPGTTP